MQYKTSINFTKTSEKSQWAQWLKNLAFHHLGMILVVRVLTHLLTVGGIYLNRQSQ